jgi:ketosteroid isomerase-like protein
VVVDLHHTLAPFDWMLGHWTRGEGTEHWIAAGRALWGVGFSTRGGATVFFEVMWIDADKAGKLQLTALPGGAGATVFPLAERSERAATFRNPQHDSPIAVAYARRADDQLIAQLEERGGKKPPPLAFRRAEAPRAGPLEAADRAFAADVAARGVDGWVAAFAEDGVLFQGAGVVRGPAAIRAAMAPMLSNPDARLVWEPVTSALAPAGDVGFTLGRFRALRRDKGGPFEERARGTYVSVWKRQADGGWKVIWDGGHPE